MKSETSIQGDLLANALRFLGVNFIAIDQEITESIHKHPSKLIKALAQSEEARLRLSLIPLFLDHPEFSRYVSRIANGLNKSERLTLQCYYMAAMFFQKKFSSMVEIKHELPDLFSKVLNVDHSPDLDICLKNLSARHQALGQTSVNWLGTYQHAAQIWIWEKTNTTITNG